MKVFKHIALALSLLLLVSSCAIDEIWQGVDTQDEEKVLTFKPRFYDFEAATKAIGDGSKVDKLLVHVYEGTDFKAYEFDIESKEVKEEVKIPFFHGKDYKVYFWAYSSDNDAYEIGESGLKGGVTVNYPDDTQTLTYESLEYLDAFYSVKEINLSDPGKDVTEVKLTRPFAQVNLAADAQQLKDAGATAVSFNIVVATEYIPGGEVLESEEYTFTFSCENNFQSNDKIDENGNLYLGTMYIPVSGEAVAAEVTLTDNLGNKLKYSSSVEIPLVSNNRTNLIFEGIKPAWNDENCDDASDVPSTVGDDGWIHITTPEELAALLIFGAEGAQYHICNDLDLTGMSAETKVRLNGTAVFENVIIDAMNTAGDGSYSVKNLKGVKAFLGTASGVTVQNLVIDGASVSSDTHVGVLVNTLSGVSSFKNVTIQNSSAATASGAAGGMVGYIVRTDEKNRSETLSVTIDGCKVNSVTADGSLAEGKFVGLLSGYDNGEQLVFTSTCTMENTSVHDWESPYKNGNQSVWLIGNDYSMYDSWLGDEVYYRGKVYFGGTDEAANRFCRKWDGKTNLTKVDIEPLLADPEYDGANVEKGDNRFAVYSPFDLAGVRAKTASPSAIYLKTDVDMNGQGEDGKYFVPDEFESAINSTDDNVFYTFYSVSKLEGFDNTIYHLKIEHLAKGSTTAAFIGSANGITYHQNVTFDGCCVISTHKVVPSDAKAYGAIVCCNVSGTYYMKNVNVVGSNLFALQKIGVLCAVVDGTSNFNNCSVEKCHVENYKCDITEDFSKLLTDYGLYCAKCEFFPHGEVGGLIGFLSSQATIHLCSVKDTQIYCYGQKDKKTRIGANWLLAVNYNVPGRHVNQFIGDIRTQDKDTPDSVIVTESSVSNNKYGRDQWNHSFSNTSSEFIGCAYAIPILDNVANVSINGVNITLQNFDISLLNEMSIAESMSLK